MKRIAAKIETHKQVVKQRGGKDPDIEIITTTYWPPQHGITNKISEKGNS